VLICGFGYQPERLIAYSFLALYTLFFSLPLLLAIVFTINVNYDSTFLFLPLVNGPRLDPLSSSWFSLAFFVKFPVFFFHSWLPRAHVEAPVFGSIILAAVILKLGVYGFVRINSSILSFNSSSIWLMSIALIGVICSVIIATLQVDLKCFIAFTSVLHLSFLLQFSLLDYYFVASLFDSLDFIYIYYFSLH
jgi:NADH-ubiquinone oxidoreductase chain 4